MGKLIDRPQEQSPTESDTLVRQDRRTGHALDRTVRAGDATP